MENSIDSSYLIESEVNNFNYIVRFKSACDMRLRVHSIEIKENDIVVDHNKRAEQTV